MVVLDKDKPADSFIEIDPLYWFEPIAPTIWNNATLTTIDGVETILVNKDLNPPIYNVVTARLNKAVTATFQD